MSGWTAWRPDFFTWAWVAWIAAFAVLETWALWQGRGQELTAHLRPLFQGGGALSPLWFIGLGVWIWLGLHFLVDGLFVNRG